MDALHFPAFSTCLLLLNLLCDSHYEYDAKKIKAAYGGKDIDALLGPGAQLEPHLVLSICMDNLIFLGPCAPHLR